MAVTRSLLGRYERKGVVVSKDQYIVSLKNLLIDSYGETVDEFFSTIGTEKTRLVELNSLQRDGDYFLTADGAAEIKKIHRFPYPFKLVQEQLDLKYTTALQFIKRPINNGHWVKWSFMSFGRESIYLDAVARDSLIGHFGPDDEAEDVDFVSVSSGLDGDGAEPAKEAGPTGGDLGDTGQPGAQDGGRAFSSQPARDYLPELIQELRDRIKEKDDEIASLKQELGDERKRGEENLRYSQNEVRYLHDRIERYAICFGQIKSVVDDIGAAPLTTRLLPARFHALIESSKQKVLDENPTYEVDETSRTE